MPEVGQNDRGHVSFFLSVLAGEFASGNKVLRLRDKVISLVVQFFSVMEKV
ncbi:MULTISPECIES: hypothetical protein [Bacillales]|uniref:hypothetical protein n=1 Tax=Bacillales TaxID=1385 RepID=UPI000B1025C2|nr:MULTISPECIES: hypothetical protein [Bacillales]